MMQLIYDMTLVQPSSVVFFSKTVVTTCIHI